MRNPRARAWTLYGVAVGGVVALHLATNGNYGFHTDELYYLDCGRHPAFGYVDFPPVVPLLARLETGILGVSPWSLRLLPTLLGGVMVALSGLYVRRLGGSLPYQAMALLVAVVAPYFLGANWVFQTVTFDEFCWMVALYWFLGLVIDRAPKYWIYLGVTLGFGLEVKFTILGLIAGIGLAVLVTPSLRAMLRTRHPWIAAAIALVIWAPNLAWQVAEGFPTVAYVTNHAGSGGGPVSYLVEILVYLFFLIPLWAAGFVSLFRNLQLRPVAIACAFPLAAFLFVGKSYYSIGAVPIVMGAGVLALSHVQRPRLGKFVRIGAVAACVLEFVTFALIALPVVPPDRIHADGLDAANEVLADSVGWDSVASQVVSIYQGLPDSERSSLVIVSAYYGVRGALQVYVDPRTLPPVVSPQLSDWYWLPSDIDASYALMVDYQPSDVAFMCASPALVAHLTVPYGVKGLEQGAPVTLCRLEGPISSYWGRLKNFS